jgi:tyrosine-protein kinase Etk/Wzc
MGGMGEAGMKSEVTSESAQKEMTRNEPDQELHLLDLLTLLSERRKFIAWFTLGAAVLTAVIVIILPSKYTAATLIMPPGQNSSMSSALLGQLGGSGALASIAGGSLGIKNPGDMYVSLFRSRTVEDALIKRFGLMSRYHKKTMEDARTAFDDRSAVVLGVKDGLIHITVTDRDPKLAADMANAYVDEFHKQSDNLAITEASQRRAFFQQQLLEANQNLTTAEEALKRAEQLTGVLQIDSQAKSLIQSAATLNGQIAAKEVQLQGMRSFATEDNPQMMMAEQQLGALKAQLAKMTGTSENSSSDIIMPRGNIPQAGMEYLNKLRDVRYYETVEELIAKQFELAKLDEARQGQDVQVVDPAVPPEKRSFPKRTLTILIATILGLLVACGWSLLAHGFESLKNDPAKRVRLERLRSTFK